MPMGTQLMRAILKTTTITYTPTTDMDTGTGKDMAPEAPESKQHLLIPRLQHPPLRCHPQILLLLLVGQRDVAAHPTTTITKQMQTGPRSEPVGILAHRHPHPHHRQSRELSVPHPCFSHRNHQSNPRSWSPRGLGRRFIQSV